MHAQIEVRLDQIRINDEMSIEDKLKALFYVLQSNYARRKMPLQGIKYSLDRRVLRAEVPVVTLDG